MVRGIVHVVTEIVLLVNANERGVVLIVFGGVDVVSFVVGFANGITGVAIANLNKRTTVVGFSGGRAMPTTTNVNKVTKVLADSAITVISVDPPAVLTPKIAVKVRANVILKIVAFCFMPTKRIVRGVTVVITRLMCLIYFYNPVVAAAICGCVKDGGRFLNFGQLPMGRHSVFLVVILVVLPLMSIVGRVVTIFKGPDAPVWVVIVSLGRRNIFVV